MNNKNISLDDKYISGSGTVYVTGIQALVRLPISQSRKDRVMGLNTAGYISGYRGSPLGGYDTALWKADKHLQLNNIKFQPSVNEDLAATACWGTQQLGFTENPKYDGIFSIWYGKGPGVDRSGDPLRHANLAGSSPNGGVLALAGDDHVAKSSTTAHQSEQSLIAAMIPILNPSSVQELFDFGLFGISLSRYAGVWVGLKCVNEIVESSSTIFIDETKKFSFPEKTIIDAKGVHIRWPDDFVEQEERLINIKVEAAKEFVLENNLDKITHHAKRKKLGIVSTGKAWLDVCESLNELGTEDELREKFGISVYKVAMSWPLEPTKIRKWASGFDEVLVVEEKRNIIENQLARILYDIPEEFRPTISGKKSSNHEILVPAYGELTPNIISEVILSKINSHHKNNINKDNFNEFSKRLSLKEELTKPEERTPWFCAGCPHNTSTKVPEGSRALSGIGCHYMANWMDRSTGAFTHMGGEGASWIGLAPFSKEKHVFQNIGDGTYFHSGLLAIRAAVASNVNITYKILFNDAVAMTGGQPFEGNLFPWTVSWQLAAEGVKKTVVVTDNTSKYNSSVTWSPGVKIYHRSQLDRLQKELREIKGVTAIIYDQVCAAELRRRRKRGTIPEPKERIYINSDVCEGCGDCNSKSNCVAIHPLETELGRKREIEQSSCNKDFSCMDGFCPSFVSLEGAELKNKNKNMSSYKTFDDRLPLPELKKINGEYNILLAGIGGAGVVTAGAILGMAAHIEAKGTSVLDQTGLSQKNGAVFGHIKIYPEVESLKPIRIGSQKANLVIGFDMIVAASEVSVNVMKTNQTQVVVDKNFVPLARLSESPDMEFDAAQYINFIIEKVGSNFLKITNATDQIRDYHGTSTSSNIFMLGYAFQKGFLPLELSSIEKAINLNEVAVQQNLEAFNLGRITADKEKLTEGLIAKDYENEYNDNDNFIDSRIFDLCEYQNRNYANHYKDLVNQTRQVELSLNNNKTSLTQAVSKSLYKLMAYKDEYEVARLLTRKNFYKELNQKFSGNFKIKYHLAPPFLALNDKYSKLPKKITLGSWFRFVLIIISKGKFLRGTLFDPFRWHPDRKEERELILNYENLLKDVLENINDNNFEIGVELLTIPQKIRGYGYVKKKNIRLAYELQKKLTYNFSKRGDA